MEAVKQKIESLKREVSNKEDLVDKLEDEIRTQKQEAQKVSDDFCLFLK